MDRITPWRRGEIQLKKTKGGKRRIQKRKRSEVDCDRDFEEDLKRQTE